MEVPLVVVVLATALLVGVLVWALFFSGNKGTASSSGKGGKGGSVISSLPAGGSQVIAPPQPMPAPQSSAPASYGRRWIPIGASQLDALRSTGQTFVVYYRMDGCHACAAFAPQAAAFAERDDLASIPKVVIEANDSKDAVPGYPWIVHYVRGRSFPFRSGQRTSAGLAKFVKANLIKSQNF